MYGGDCQSCFSMHRSSGVEVIKTATLLLGSIFKILLSCDLISNMAWVDIGVICATLHFNV